MKVQKASIPSIKKDNNPTKKEIEFLFDKKLDVASDILGIGTTKLKMLCRQYGIKKWPFRENLKKPKLSTEPIKMNFPNYDLPEL